MKNNDYNSQTSEKSRTTDLTYEKTVTKYTSNSKDDKKIVNINNINFTKDFDELKKIPKKKWNNVYFYLIAFISIVCLITLIILLSIYLV